MQTFPFFGSAASLISPPGGTVTSGYFPLQYLPAENLNYYLNALTQATTEITTVISGLGLTPGASYGQMLNGLAQSFGRQPPAGLLYTYVSTTSFSIGAGGCGDNTFVNYMYLGSTYTKTLSAWAVGSGNGSLDTGAIGASTWYYVYLIKNVTTNTVDILISASPTTPTMPSGYTLKRLFQAFKTNGSSQITQTICYPDGTQEYIAPPIDVNDSTLTTSKKTYSLTFTPAFQTAVHYYASLSNAAVSDVQIYGNTNTTDTATVQGNVMLRNPVAGSTFFSLIQVILNSNSVFARSDAASTTITLAVRDYNIRPFC